MTGDLDPVVTVCHLTCFEVQPVQFCDSSSAVDDEICLKAIQSPHGRQMYAAPSATACSFFMARCRPQQEQVAVVWLLSGADVMSQLRTL